MLIVLAIYQLLHFSINFS